MLRVNVVMPHRVCHFFKTGKKEKNKKTKKNKGMQTKKSNGFPMPCQAKYAQFAVGEAHILKKIQRYDIRL